MPATLITDLAETKLARAAGSGEAVKITHVALGDGGGANYAPSKFATALRRERVRRAIEKRHMVSDRTWRIVVNFPPETESFHVREMGFFDEAGDLIAIWAGADVDARQTGAINWLIDQTIDLRSVAEGLIIVQAPDDELFDFSLVMLAEQASQRLHMFQMNERILAA